MNTMLKITLVALIAGCGLVPQNAEAGFFSKSSLSTVFLGVSVGLAYYMFCKYIKQPTYAFKPYYIPIKVYRELGYATITFTKNNGLMVTQQFSVTPNETMESIEERARSIESQGLAS